MKNDIGSGLREKTEKSPNLNFEYIQGPWATRIGSYIFSPHPHVGISINTRQGTHQFYAGLTWRLNFGDFFIEPSLGGEIHTAHLKINTSSKKALGSRLLFREALAIGYQITEKNSVSILLDHASNMGFTKPNRGITTVGFRYGYKLQVF